MKSKPSVSHVAALFGVPASAVKNQFAINAAQLRAMAERAGNGKFRGNTAAQWNELADHAEKQSKTSMK